MRALRFLAEIIAFLTRRLSLSPTVCICLRILPIEVVQFEGELSVVDISPAMSVAVSREFLRAGRRILPSVTR